MLFWEVNTKEIQNLALSSAIPGTLTISTTKLPATHPDAVGE